MNNRLSVLPILLLCLAVLAGCATLGSDSSPEPEELYMLGLQYENADGIQQSSVWKMQFSS